MSETPEGRVKRMIKRKLSKWFIYPANDDVFDQPLQRVDGWFYMPSQNGMGVTGIPDFVGVWQRYGTARSVPWMIEAKAPGGVMTANQEQRKVEVERVGVLHRVVWDEDTMTMFLDDLFHGSD
jgi:hypothetical protein